MIIDILKHTEGEIKVTCGYTVLVLLRLLITKISLQFYPQFQNIHAERGRWKQHEEEEYLPKRQHNLL